MRLPFTAVVLMATASAHLVPKPKLNLSLQVAEQVKPEVVPSQPETETLAHKPHSRSLGLADLHERLVSSKWAAGDSRATPPKKDVTQQPVAARPSPLPERPPTHHYTVPGYGQVYWQLDLKDEEAYDSFFFGDSLHYDEIPYDFKDRLVDHKFVEYSREHENASNEAENSDGGGMPGQPKPPK